MVTKTAIAQNSRSKIGWFFLLILSALMTLNHLVLMFGQNEPTLFTSYTAFNLYAFLVLLIPFRQGKKWAWMASWILPVVLALTAFFVPDIAPYYYGSAAACVIGLLLTMPELFPSSMGK
jgi:hypothetical protein